MVVSLTQSRVASGSVVMWCGSAASVPTGWLLCVGTPVSRITYSRLFTAIGEQYGRGDGSSTFLLPNFRSCIPVGMNVNSTRPAFQTLGSSNSSTGTNTVKLTN